jgi:PAS domain-containing protein
MDQTLTLSLILVATSVLSVLAALLLAGALERRKDRDQPQLPTGDAVFLIADGVMVDANDAGTALLETLRAQAAGAAGATPADYGPQASVQSLLQHLASAFPDLGSRIAVPAPPAVPGDGWSLTAADGSGLRLQAADADGALRLVLGRDASGTDSGAAHGDDTVLLDRFSWRALNDELQVLRRTTDSAPTPAWRERADGQVVWANGAYLRLLAEVGGAGPSIWPLPALFAGASAQGGRHSLTVGPGNRRRWFDLCVIPEGSEVLVFALSADDAQQAERTRREFVQTLTKTFASLPVGLAVFDRTRRLQLFNPALADLTRLEPEFLASRPGMDGFLNRMRDKRILPEPRDYRAWSRRLLDVETAAGGSAFEEIWALPDGRSFRVSVAPHPDGALAFLLEDVTSDTRLKRSFRAELDLGRAALDMAETALAVFSPSGDLAITNAAFDRLWTLEGADTLSGVQFAEAISNWREIAAETGSDTALWDAIADLARTGTLSGQIDGQIMLPDGETLSVSALAAPGGGVVLGFTQTAPHPVLATTARRPLLRARA